VISIRSRVHFQEKIRDSSGKVLHDIDRMIHAMKEMATRSRSIIDMDEIQDDLMKLQHVKIAVDRISRKY
jgi:hypothetical protein